MSPEILKISRGSPFINLGHLEEEAVKRKERLAALKRKLAGNGGDTGNAEKKSTDENTDLPKPIFRYRKRNEF